MKLFEALFGPKKREIRKTLAEYQREKLVDQGKQQFQKMKDLGVKFPVSLA
jgi:hypothetical protein